jgi:hypothetical protein
MSRPIGLVENACRQEGKIGLTRIDRNHRSGWEVGRLDWWRGVAS